MGLILWLKCAGLYRMYCFLGLFCCSPIILMTSFYNNTFLLYHLQLKIINVAVLAPYVTTA